MYLVSKYYLDLYLATVLLHCIVLYLCIYVALLAVHANQ